MMKSDECPFLAQMRTALRIGISSTKELKTDSHWTLHYRKNKPGEGIEHCVEAGSSEHDHLLEGRFADGWCVRLVARSGSGNPIASRGAEAIKPMKTGFADRAGDMQENSEDKESMVQCINSFPGLAPRIILNKAYVVIGGCTAFSVDLEVFLC